MHIDILYIFTEMRSLKNTKSKSSAKYRPRQNIPETHLSIFIFFQEKENPQQVKDTAPTVSWQSNNTRNIKEETIQPSNNRFACSDSSGIKASYQESPQTVLKSAKMGGINQSEASSCRKNAKGHHLIPLVWVTRWKMCFVGSADNQIVWDA